MDADPDGFDCAACPLAESLASLDYDNARAWGLFQRLTSRFLVDTQTAPIIFDRLTRDLDTDELTDLTERLRVLYDTLCPAPETK